MVASSVLDGQLSLFEVPVASRIFCPDCRANWGPDLKDWVLERLAGEHAHAEDGRCAEMVRLGVTEPYYSPSDTPWLSGWSVPYPRPVGFRGLDQLRSRNAG